MRALQLFMTATLLASTEVHAQVLCNGLPCSADGTPFDLAAVQAKVAATAAAIPLPATTVAPSELVTPTVGTPGRYRPADAPNPRISRTGTLAVAGSQGMLSATWTVALPTATSTGVAYSSFPVYFTPIAAVNTAPAKWKVISADNTGFVAQCSQEVSALGVTLATLTAAGITGLSIPLNTPCAAGTQVFALQLPATQ